MHAKAIVTAEQNSAGGPVAVLAVGDAADERLLEASAIELFPNVRLLLSCGDLPVDYLEAVADRFRVPLLYVRGNHDGRRPDAALPGENIHGRVVSVGGLRILGFEGSNWYNGEGVQYTERQMWWKIQAARPAVWRARGVDIIVTHAPPFGIHDAPDVCHTGFKAFRALLDALRPRYFVHGHTHLDYSPTAGRIAVIGETRVVNAFRSVLLTVDAPVHTAR
jgi:Icc-related predicted phosphoesterase